MNEILPETNENFVAVRVSGKLDEHDYEQYLPVLERRISTQGKISLYWEMVDFDGWTGGGLWADTKFDVKHANDFTRIALVGEKKWHDLMTQALKPFTSADIKYFDIAERDRALQWAQSGATPDTQPR